MSKHTFASYAIRPSCLCQRLIPLLRYCTFAKCDETLAILDEISTILCDKFLGRTFKRFVLGKIIINLKKSTSEISLERVNDSICQWRVNCAVCNLCCCFAYTNLLSLTVFVSFDKILKRWEFSTAHSRKMRIWIWNSDGDMKVSWSCDKSISRGISDDTWNKGIPNRRWNVGQWQSDDENETKTEAIGD